MPEDRSPIKVDESKYQAFLGEVEKANLSALWERYRTGIAHGLHPEKAMIWPWKTVEPLIGRTTEMVSMPEAQRRVLTLVHPDPRFNGEATATNNLNAGFQILMPGERAPPHRHTANALRFVIEGEGAITEVNGKPCPMNFGDMILNPGWVWHAHEHKGASRVIWVDSLDVPMFNREAAMFFQPGPPGNLPPQHPDATFSVGGFAPVDVERTEYSPMYRFAWEDALKALSLIPPDEDGARRIRYINPSTGGSIMSLMDCFMFELAKDLKTRKTRSTSNAVFVVAEGEGESHVGDETFSWTKRDVFTVPHWTYATHVAKTDKARLFAITDRETMRKLGMLKDEAA